MKKITTAILLACTIFTVACNKTTTTPAPATTQTTTPTIPTDGWELDGTKYTQTWAANTQAVSMSAGDGSIGSGNSMNFFFSALPTTDGTYRVIMYGGGGSTIGANEVGVSAGLETAQKTYVSTGTGSVDVKVTFVSGKMHIELPEIDVADTKDLTKTVKLKGTLKQTL